MCGPEWTRPHTGRARPAESGFALSKGPRSGVDPRQRTALAADRVRPGTANVALPALFARSPKLSLAVPLEKLRWTANLGDRSLFSVPIRLRSDERPA